MKKENEKGLNIFDEKDHRGQLFIMAAIIIAVIAVGILAVTNYSQTNDVEKTYEIAEGMGIEGQNVLDYGTYNELNESEMKTLEETFIKNYVDYMHEEKNIYFIFGNGRNISVIGYQEVVNESVCVDVSQGTKTCTPYLEIGHAQRFPVEVGINKVAIIIGGRRHSFQLKKGENFYFVVWQKFGGGKIVVTSKD
jgi:hypothetical protein